MKEFLTSALQVGAAIGSLFFGVLGHGFGRDAYAHAFGIGQMATLGALPRRRRRGPRAIVRSGRPLPGGTRQKLIAAGIAGPQVMQPVARPGSPAPQCPRSAGVPSGARLTVVEQLFQRLQRAIPRLFQQHVSRDNHRKDRSTRSQPVSAVTPRAASTATLTATSVA